MKMNNITKMVAEYNEETGRLQLVLPSELMNKVDITYTDLDAYIERKMKEENTEVIEHGNEKNEEPSLELTDENRERARIFLNELMNGKMISPTDDLFIPVEEEYDEEEHECDCSSCEQLSCAKHPINQKEEEIDLGINPEQFIKDVLTGNLDSNKMKDVTDKLKNVCDSLGITNVPRINESLGRLNELSDLMKNHEEKQAIKEIDSDELVELAIAEARKGVSEEDLKQMRRQLMTLKLLAGKSTDEAIQEDIAKLEYIYQVAKQNVKPSKNVSSDNRRPNGQSATRIINGKRTTGLVDRIR